MSNIFELITKDLQVAKAALEASPSKNVIFGYLGMPGIGKTEMVKQAAEHLGLAFFGDMVLSCCSPLDIMGKLPHHDNKTLLSYPNSDIPTADKVGDTPGLWFIDEVTNATSDTLKALQQGLLSRKFGEHELGKNVIIVLAGNRQADKAGSGLLSTALYNRVTWRNLEWSTDHSQAALSYIIRKHTAGSVLSEDATATLALLQAYFAFKPITSADFTDALTKLGREPYVQWCSPRSLEALVCRIKALGWSLPTVDDMAGDIGVGRAAELTQFNTVMAHVPEFKAVVRDPDGTALPDHNRLDVKFATINTFAMRCAQVKYTTKTEATHPLISVWKYLSRWADISLQLVFILAMHRVNPAVMGWPAMSKLLASSPQLVQAVAKLS